MFRYSQYFPYNFYSTLSGMHSIGAALDSLIQKKDCTLEELLAEDEIVSEVTNRNSNILNL